MTAPTFDAGARAARLRGVLTPEQWSSLDEAVRRGAERIADFIEAL